MRKILPIRCHETPRADLQFGIQKNVHIRLITNTNGGNVISHSEVDVTFWHREIGLLVERENYTAAVIHIYTYDRADSELYVHGTIQTASR